jgi:molecular chaperone HscC
MSTAQAVSLGGQTLQAEDLSALVLQSLRADAQAFLGVPVTDVIISVPAYFNDAQRKATHAAAGIAGLKVLRLINEPTAAALAYGLHRAQSETKFLIFDLGGGTLDVSVVELFEGVIEVKASTGDNQLGGEDFTAVIAQMLADQWLTQQNLALLMAGKTADKTSLALAQQTPAARAFLHAQAERGKLALTQNDASSWDASFDGAPVHFELSQGAFETHAQALLDRLRKPVERALRDAKLRVADMNDVVLVGGASRMPIVRRLLARILGRELKTHIHPDEAIALGAAVQSGLAAQDAALADVMMTDVCPYSLGTDILQMISEKDSIAGVYSPIIERNTLIPASRTSTYWPSQDFQTVMLFNIYQGESRLVKDNIYLGQIEVPIPRMKKTDVSAKVRFSYDVSGLLEVDVVIEPGNIKHTLTLLGQASHLSDADIAQRRARLMQLKIDPREDQPNRALIARLDRLYSEYLGHQRDAIGSIHGQFLAALATEDPQKIARARLHTTRWCDNVEMDNQWDINDWGNDDEGGDTDGEGDTRDPK